MLWVGTAYLRRHDGRLDLLNISKPRTADPRNAKWVADQRAFQQVVQADEDKIVTFAIPDGAHAPTHLYEIDWNVDHER